MTSSKSSNLLCSLLLTIMPVLVVGMLFYAATSYAIEEVIQVPSKNHTVSSAIRLTPKEKAWLQQNQNIRVAVKSAWMPIEFKLESERHRGIAVDYLAEISKLLNVNFTVVDFPENTEPADVDMLSGMIGNQEKYPDFHIMSQPFLVVPYVIYINHNNPQGTKIKSLDDLKSKRLAVYKHGVLSQKIAENYPNIQLVHVDIADDAFQLLEAGKIDAYVGNQLVVDYHVSVHRMSFVKKVAPTPFTSSVYMAVHDNHQELASILEKTMMVIGQNNADILNNWQISYLEDDQHLRWLGLLVAIIFIAGITRLHQLSQNIKRQKSESQAQIWQQANYDHLTGLPNRHLLQSRLEQAIAKADSTKLPAGILFIDLDNFKHVNDTSGHSTGDLLLTEAAKRIARFVRHNDTVARFGGDEFMVVMSDIRDVNILEQTCQKILHELQQPFVINKDTFFISASIGITLYPNDGSSYEELLSHADQAMYEAKKAGKNCFQFFTESIQSASLKKLSITNDLRKAQKNNEFELYYQPIVNLADGKINKAEALIRWIHPEKGLIGPVEFIPLAEESGMIHELGDWVFSQALHDLKVIQASTHEDFQISINVSPYQFQNPDKLLNWIALLKAQPVQGGRISIEITERILLEPSSSVINTIAKLRQAGIELSIDDFGTGYSALAYLKKFNIDYVKIDKSFIQNLTDGGYDTVLCEAIINMARKLDVRVVAEGIETPLQKQFLSDCLCNFGQGYLIAKPMQLSAFLEFLKAGNK
jgi:diguanylate cyclase (GGDEF)-like protein